MREYSHAFLVPVDLGRRYARGEIDEPALWFSPWVNSGTCLFVATLFGTYQFRRLIRALRSAPPLTAITFKTRNDHVIHQARKWKFTEAHWDAESQIRFWAEGETFATWLNHLKTPAVITFTENQTRSNAILAR